MLYVLVGDVYLMFVYIDLRSLYVIFRFAFYSFFLFFIFFLLFFFFLCCCLCVFFFFFQAEDGIRDADVTGVQTCALPICPFVQGDAQFFIGAQQLRINVVQALGHVFFFLGRGVVRDGVVVHLREVYVGPLRLVHFQPATVGLQAPFQHELRLLLDLGQAADYVFVEAGLEGVGFYLGHESVFVFPFDQLFHLFIGGRHDRRSVILSSGAWCLSGGAGLCWPGFPDASGE